jgi:predicted membrane metal-binding protein
VVVIGLITLYPLFWDAMKPMWKTDRMRAQEETWRKCLMGCSKYIMGLLAISCAAWLTSMPLTAYYFGRFTPIAILGNLAVIPLAFMIVLGGCLSFVLGSLLDVMAEIFNHAALLAIKMFMVSIDAFSRVPFSSAEVPRPSLTWVVLWYVVLSAVAFILWQRRRGKSMDTRSRR